jgi:uncharacterized membrane protein
MTQLNVGREVEASADAVWRVVTDLDNSPQVISAIGRVERLDGRDGFGVGTRWRETRQMFGKEATEAMEVTAIDPGRSYTVESDARGAHYTSTITVDSLGEHRSRLSMTFSGEPKGPVSRLAAATIGKLFEGATRKALQSDLDDIAGAAQQRG